jgi:hypothetical protein
MAKVLSDHVRTLEADEEDGRIVRLVRLYRVIEVSGTDYRVLTNALGESAIPEYGDKLATPSELGNLIVTKREARLVDGDQATVDVIVTYEHFEHDGQSFENPPEGQFVPEGDASLQQVTSNLDRDGGTISVEHTYVGDAKFGNDTKTQGGTVSFQQPQRVIRLTGRKITNRPWLVSTSIVGKLNNVAWYGAAAETWICSRVSYRAADVTGATNVYYFTFEFTNNPDGWQPFVTFIDPRTGKPPTDLVAGTGYKQVDRYDVVDFEGVIGQRIHG